MTYRILNCIVRLLLGPDYKIIKFEYSDLEPMRCDLEDLEEEQ